MASAMAMLPLPGNTAYSHIGQPCTEVGDHDCSETLIWFGLVYRAPYGYKSGQSEEKAYIWQCQWQWQCYHYELYPTYFSMWGVSCPIFLTNI